MSPGWAAGFGLVVSVPSLNPMRALIAAHRVLRGAQSRDACAGVASSRKQLRVVYVVVGRSSRLNSRLHSPTGVGSMNVDKPAPSTDGAAHIRGAEGTIMVVLSRRPSPNDALMWRVCVVWLLLLN